jgi:hypothetical protein
MSKFDPSGKAMTKDMVRNLVKDAMKRKPEFVREVLDKSNIPGDTAEEITEHLWSNMPPGGVGFMDKADEARFSNNKEDNNE